MVNPSSNAVNVSDDEYEIPDDYPLDDVEEVVREERKVESRVEEKIDVSELDEVIENIKRNGIPSMDAAAMKELVVKYAVGLHLSITEEKKIDIFNKLEDVEGTAKLIMMDVCRRDINLEGQNTLIQAVALYSLKQLQSGVNIRSSLMSIQFLIANFSSSFYQYSVVRYNSTFAETISRYDWIDALYVVNSTPIERKWVRSLSLFLSLSTLSLFNVSLSLFNLSLYLSLSYRLERE